MDSFEMKKMSESLSREAMLNTIGGGEWSWGEALYCFAIGGAIGVVAYTIGTMQDWLFYVYKSEYMCELSKNDLVVINGGAVDPVSFGLLIIAAAEVYVQILDHCYNVGKD